MIRLPILIKDIRSTRLPDILVGIPAGLVIFLAAFLLIRLRENIISTQWAFFLLAALVAFLVGLLIRLVRFSRAPHTALIAGITSIGLLGWLVASVYKNQPFTLITYSPGLLLVGFSPWAASRISITTKGKA